MIHAFSGDAFLAGRAFLQAALQTATDEARTLVRLGEDLDARAVDEVLRQGGLFGRPVVALDLDAAFAATGGGRDAGGRGAVTSERNAVLALLESAPADVTVFVLDAAATPARQRRWRSLGTLEHLATPRFGNLLRWVRQELERQGIATSGDVAATVIDLFGEDLPSIASELAKLRVLDEPLTPERAAWFAHRPAARSAFQLIDAVMAGDAATSLATLQALLGLGEAPMRVLATFLWQVDLVAGCLGLLTVDPDIEAEAAAAALEAAPYPTRKALAIAARLDEDALLELLEVVMGADVAMKRGSDPERRLQTCMLQAARLMAGRRPGHAA